MPLAEVFEWRAYWAAKAKAEKKAAEQSQRESRLKRRR